MIPDYVDAEAPSVATESVELLQKTETEPKLTRYGLVHALVLLWRKPTAHPPLEFFAYLGDVTDSQVVEMWEREREKQQRLEMMYEQQRNMRVQEELEAAIAARARAREVLLR